MYYQFTVKVDAANCEGGTPREVRFDVPVYEQVSREAAVTYFWRHQHTLIHGHRTPTHPNGIRLGWVENVRIIGIREVTEQ